MSESKRDWLDWGLKILIPVALTLIANAVMFGKYIKTVEDTEVGLKEIRSEFVKHQVDQGRTEEQYKQILQRIDDLARELREARRK